MNRKIVEFYLLVRSRFLGLSADKRQLLMLLLLGLSLFLYCLLIWYPLYNAIQDLKEETAKKEKLLVWVNKTAVELSLLNLKAIKNLKPENTSLLTLIDQEAKKNTWGSYAIEMKQLDNKHIEVSFNAIIFDDVINGLEDIWKKYNIKVVSFSAHRTKSENLVQVSFILE